MCTTFRLRSMIEIVGIGGEHREIVWDIMKWYVESDLCLGLCVLHRWFRDPQPTGLYT